MLVRGPVISMLTTKVIRDVMMTHTIIMANMAQTITSNASDHQ